MSDVVHLTDLREPTFSPEVMEIFDVMATMAADSPLDRRAIETRAVAETGLDDFGGQDYGERLDVYLAALRDVPDLSPYGQVSFHAQILQLLKNRLVLTDLLARHPEIHDIEIRSPIIIAGLPRTGTTHLHNLLSADPGLRSLPYWESREPVPVPQEVGIEPDPRLERTDQALWFLGIAMPHFALMHEMTTWHVHEEIQLLAIDFSTMLFETLAPVPAWTRYYQAHDQTPHYRYLRTILQALQFLRGGERWLLKSPQHLEQLPVLADVFPDATVVLTHRDPVEVTVSMVTMLAYATRMHALRVDVDALASSWVDRLATMLDACVAQRDALPPERSTDVRFDDFMQDDVGTVRAICELADHELDGVATRAIDTYLAEHRRGRLGRIEYRADDLGLDLDELRTRFTTYVDAFL